MQRKTYSDRNQRSQKYLVGMAIHALRAYVKALELKAGDGRQYSFVIPEDGKTAQILNPEGQAVMARTIEKWASEGPALRLSMIGLKGMKEKFEKVAAVAGQRESVRFYLNVLENKATLTVDNVPLSKSDLLNRLPALATPDTLMASLPGFAEEELSSISDWARIGRELEVEFFHILETAEKFSLVEAAQQERERGYRLGLLRRPKASLAVDEQVG